MTDDRSLERAARSWLEEGPTRAPNRPVEAALARIQSTPQERGPLVPWRLPTVNPALKLATAAVVAAIAIGGSLFVLRGPGGFGGSPTPSTLPTTAPTATPPAATQPPTPEPFTGACTLITSEEAESTAGVEGLGAFLNEVATGDGTACLYSDGGGTPVLRLTWTPAGGTASFDDAAANPGVDMVAGLGDGAVFDPSTYTLHVRQGDAHLAVVVGDQEANRTEAERRARAESIAELALPRM